VAHIEDRAGRDGLRWRVRWRDPERRWRSKSFARKADAERYLHRLQADLDTGSYIAPSDARLVLGAVTETWWRSHSPLLKPSTAVSYRGVLDLIVLPRWGSTPVGRVTHADISAWVGDLTRDGVSASRIRHAHGLLAQVLDLAVADRRLAANPARGVRLPPLPMRSRHRYLTHGELLQLGMAAGYHRTLILVLGYTGLRWGEAVALRHGDFDPVGRRLHVGRTMSEVGGRLVEGTPKTHERRSVPVPSLVAELLPTGGHPDELLIPAPRGGVYRSTNFRTQVWLPLLESTGTVPMRVHDLRHTAASLAVSAGGNVLVVARMLGHRDPSITLRVYADLFDQDLDDVAKRMDDAARASEGAQSDTEALSARRWTDRP
jgi:integrase